MTTYTLSSDEILATLTDETREILGVDKLHFPKFYSSPAVAFDFRSLYITQTGSTSKGRRTYSVTIWEDPVLVGRFSLHVNRKVPSGVGKNVLHRRGLDADDVNHALVSLVP